MANAIRVLLILGSLLAVSTAAVWAFVPRLVVAFDEGLHRHWTARARVDLQSVDDLVAAGKLETAEERLAELLEALDGVQPGDLLDESYRTALEGHVRLLRMLERHDDAVAAARDCVAYDEKDLESHLRLGRLLLERAETADEGEAALARVFELVPEWSQAAEVYAEHLVDHGRDEEAADVALRFARRAASVQLHDWALRWDDGNQFDEVRTFRGSLDHDEADGRFVLRADLPEGTRRIVGVRVDPPTFARVRLRDWSVTLRSVEREVVIDAVERVHEASGMRPTTDGALEARWVARPNLVLDAEEPIDLQGPTVLEFRARVEAIFPPALDRVLDHPKRCAAVEARLEERGRDADLELWRRVRGGTR